MTLIALAYSLLCGGLTVLAVHYGDKLAMERQKEKEFKLNLDKELADGFILDLPDIDIPEEFIALRDEELKRKRAYENR